MDGSGFLKSRSGSAKIPDPSGSETLDLLSVDHVFDLCISLPNRQDEGFYGQDEDSYWQSKGFPR